MAKQGIRDDLYAAMYAAITSNVGYLYRGRDHQPGPQTGRGALLALEKKGWARLVRARIVNPRNRQVRHEVAGGWLTRKGRAELRAEIVRRGDAMPDRLATRRPAGPTAPPRRPVTPTGPTRPARPALLSPVTVAHPGCTAPAATALLDRPRSMSTVVDPFDLIATAGGRPTDDIF